jgi:hypothetical protein
MLVLAAFSGATGLWLASHYPAMPWAVSTVFVLGCITFWAYPTAWLVVVPALLPVFGFALWTGWITFEELDLLVLAVAAGGYVRRGIVRQRHDVALDRPAPADGAAALLRCVVALYATVLMVSMWRGFDDAGGFRFGWYQGYYDPLNSLRLAKPFLLALLVWPLFSLAIRAMPLVYQARWSLGLALGLIGAALATVWERDAFTSLLDFSSDYRTTALFWEMHVGGAALDGFLALTVPFAVRELAAAKTAWRWAIGALAVLLAGYACLTTFSRGVYLAIPVGLVAVLWLQAAQKRRFATKALTANRGHGLVAGGLLVTGFVLSAAWLFPTSGYRGLMAFFGAIAMLLPLVGMLRQSTPGNAVLGLGMGVGLSSVATLLALSFAKGAYVAYAVSIAACAGAVFWPFSGAARNRSNLSVILAFACFVSVLACLCLVCWRWAGEAGMGSALVIVTVMLAIALSSAGSKRTPWPDGARWQGIALSLMLVGGCAVAVLSGGAYMGFRFSTSSQDLQGRMRHWQAALESMKTPSDWLLGKGLGRFPASQLLVGTDQAHPGDHRLIQQEGSSYLVLASGKQGPDGGDMLRVSQRLSAPEGSVTVEFNVRAEAAVPLHFEVCEKHLLYSVRCISADAAVVARPGQWQALSVTLKGEPLSGGAWYAPRLIVFSLGIDSPSAVRADLDNLALRDAHGSNLLANGDFSQGLARWFFTSDHSHLPWHVKNLFLHVLFEQGAVSVVLLSVLIAGALWRLIAGNARNLALAPATAAALIGFVLVGTFDSLVDVPRVAFLFYVLLLSGVAMRDS